MTKVKVTREVAEAIVDVREMYTDSQIIAAIENDRGCTAYGTLMPTLIKFSRQAEGNIDLIMRVLVNGYEIEMTPEDNIRSYYADAIKLSQEAMYSDGKSIAIGRITAIRQTLSYLGIKYGGINA